MKTVFVYRNGLGDCTKNGISSRYDLLNLVENEGDYGTIPTEEIPENTVILVHRKLFGDGKDYPVLVPYALYMDYKKSNFAYNVWW